MSFEEFLGNHKIKKDLVDSLKQKRLPHAIIIEAQEGLGKGFFSVLLAKAIMCNDSTDYCNKCNSCKKINKNIHPDVFITEPKEQKSISVDQIREIGRGLFVYPNEAEKKVYIIKNSQDMTPQAQNALLKMIEQPPKFAVFILTVDRSEKLLSTVVSRCVVFKLDSVSFEDTIEFLNKNKKLSSDQIHTIAKQTNGNIGRAINETTKSSKDEKVKLICLEFMKKLCFSNEYEFYNFYKDFYKNKDIIKNILDAFIFLLRDILWYNNSNSENIEYYLKYIDDIKQLSSAISNDTLIKMIDIVENTKEEITQNVNFNACISSFQICIWEEVYG